MIKIEFPSDRPDLADIFSEALFAMAHPEENAAVDTDDKPDDLNGFDGEAQKPDPGFARENPPKTETPPSGAPVDHTGVQKNPEFCSSATDPFYTSGPRKGQWKKRRGVSDADYDAWHAGQKVAAPETTTGINTASAFGADTPDGELDDDDGSQPETAGEYMEWVSLKQAAGLLTQEMVNDAFAAEGLTITDIFPPATDTAVRISVGLLYNRLKLRAGA